MHRRSSLKAACLALCFSGLEFSVLADESGIPPRLTGESVESLPEETSSVISDFCSGVYSGTESWCSGLMESPTLSGDCCGYKPTLEDHGIIYQGYLTQFYQGVAAGGDEQRFSYGGKADNFLTLQGEKLGLWQGLIVSMHAETRFSEDANRDAVGLAPVNANMLWPALDNTTALSGFTITQAFSEEWAVSIGKFNTLDLFNTIYPQNGRGVDGFMNVSTLFPLSAARPLNLSVNGVGINKLKEGKVQGMLSVVDAQNSSTTVGITDLFDQGAVVIGYWRVFTDFYSLPGSHGILGEYSTRNYTSLSPADFYFLPPVGLVTAQTSDTWSLSYFGEQKLWVDCCDPKRNLGLFTSWGISDGNPNPVRWAGKRLAASSGDELLSPE
jgi:porin